MDKIYMMSADWARKLTPQRTTEELVQQKLNEFSKIITQAAMFGYREVTLQIWHKGRVREAIIKELVEAGYEIITIYGGVIVRW